MSQAATKRLVSVVQEISLARSLHAIMAIVRSAARELSDADGATFVLRDEDKCYYADEDAISPLWKGQRFPINACVSGWAMLHREAVAIEDIYADPRVPIDAYRPTFVKSLLLVPIRTKDPLGAIGVYWAERHRPSPEEKETLAALADTVCVAIDNVQLNTALERRIQDLEQANRAKDEFLMTVSHELRTPLNGILGWSDILKKPETHASDLAWGLETITRNAAALNRLIDDLLDSSEIISGQLALNKTPVDPLSVIQAAVGSVTTVADAKNIKIEIQIKTLVGMILGDAARLQQVFWNLLSNAIKFTPPGGSIAVRLDRDNESARISVADHGEGIDPEVMPFIFERFRQADSSTMRKHGGLGLGLALARFLVEAHGGRIEAQSEGLGRGSEFVIHIPLMATTRPRAAPALSSHDQGQKKDHLLAGWRVLVVDDVEDARLLVSFIVKSEGAEVREADGASGVPELIQEFQPHILLCDLCMPGEDGYSLIRRIRGAEDDAVHLPAIAVSAYVDQKSTDQALSSGFDAIVSKPVYPKKLLGTMMEVSGHAVDDPPPGAVPGLSHMLPC